MPKLQELEAERKRRMQRMAMLLDRKQKYANYQHQQQQAMRDEIADQRRAGNLNYGDEALMGGATGYMFGGPGGAAIGAGLGALSGGVKAYKQRKKEGQGSLRAALGTLTDIPSMIPSMEATTEMLPSAAMAYYGQQTRDEPTATEEIKELTPEPSTAQQIQQQPRDELYFEPWRWDVPERLRGAI